MEGQTLTSICRDVQGMPEVGRLRRFIHTNPKYKDEYKLAKEIGAEKVEDEMIDIADGMDGTINEVQRDVLRINTRKWLLAIWNRDHYGDKKQVDVNHHIDISEAMQNAEKRVTQRKQPELIEGEVIRE